MSGKKDEAEIVRKDSRSQVLAEVMSDDSNDVICIEETGPKSFKHLLDSGPRKGASIKADTPTPPQPSPLQPENIDQEKDVQFKNSSIKSKTDGNGATKRNDWDMFAEQDIDSNFDVNRWPLATYAI